MNRTPILIVLLAALAAAVALFVAGATSVAPAPPARAPCSPGTPSPGACPAFLAPAPSEPPPAAVREERPPAPASRPRAESHPVASRPRTSPRRGVRGVVASPRVALGDGTRGVNPGAWEARVYALVPSRERRVTDRIGILCRKAPDSPRGDFAIDLPTGPHLLLIQHRVARDGSAPLLEAWYAYFEVQDADRALVDLGNHAFSADFVEGIVLTEKGDPAAGAEVDFSDEKKERGDPLPRGVYLRNVASDRGAFAFSIARGDGLEVIGRLVARGDGQEARRDPVRMGEVVELRFGPSEAGAPVVLEIPWSPGLRLWVGADDGSAAFSRAGGKEPALGVVEEACALRPGAYVAEVFRSAGPSTTEWARVAFEITGRSARRIRLDPMFQPTRTVRGTARPGAKVTWIAKMGGSTLVRDSVLADQAGRFEMRGLPTTEILIEAGSAPTRVPPGCEPTCDVGELRPW